jgi:transposase
MNFTLPVPVVALIFGVTVPTAHRRFTKWTHAGLWRQVHHAVPDELGSR